MVSVGMRSAFNEHLSGEPEQDANTALTELDKGLRSLKIGEQCEAIVRFPRLFEKYPFPILINSALLKLAEVFRTGTNFPRLCVLRVCQQSEKHLDKILNVDEFVKRIFTVIHSNDPIARSLALRTLGSMAIIISERKSVQHAIRDALDSHDAVELEAAIYAASKFAAHSRTFSVNMCSKIAEMIRGPATPVPVQLQLIPVLQYMHHDASTAAMVRNLCVQLLPSYPAQNFVCVTLHTLTLLAGETLVEIPQQLLLLLEYLKDSRRSVRAQVLSDMNILAVKGAHLWTNRDVEALIEFLLEQPSVELQRRTLDVLVKLANTEATTCFALKPDSKLHFIWAQCCYSSDRSVSAKAVQLLIQLVVIQQQSNTKESLSLMGTDLSQEAAMAVEALILSLCNNSSSSTPEDTKQLKIVLASAVQLSCRVPDVGVMMVDCLVRLLLQSSGSLVLLCQSLAAIGDAQPAAIEPAAVDILSLLKRLSPHCEQEMPAIPLLCVLLFQLHTGAPNGWSLEASQTLDQAVLKLDNWTAFRIARSASRYGHHEVAHGILDRLVDQVSTEHLHFWLRGLSDFTLAESYLSGNPVGALPGNSSLMERLVQASRLYLQGLSSLKAVTNPTRALQFQSEFVRLRVEFLSAAGQLLQACRTMQTAPPPAVAHAVAAATRDELQRCGRITGQLRKAVIALRHSAELLARLRQSAFDADLDSLTNLQLQQQMALVLAEAVESTCLRASQQGTMSTTESESQLVIKIDQKHLAVRSMAQRVAQAAQLAKTFRQDHPDLKLINHLNVGCVLECLETIIETPMCFPRFFFQTLQNTNITLAVSPQPRVPGEPVTSTMGQQMAVRVEGIIQLTELSSTCVGRRVRAVQVTLTSQPNINQTGANSINIIGPDGKPLESSTISMTKTVEPHNDYFSARFLLTFPVAGLHMVNVEAALMDESDALWNAGTKAQLSVKIFEEAGAAKTASGGGNASSSSIAAGRAAVAGSSGALSSRT